MGGAWVSRQGKLTGGGIVAFFDHGGHGGTRRNAGVWGQSFVNHERHERHEKRDFWRGAWLRRAGVSCQWSVVSGQLSVVSGQLSVISFQ